MNTSTTIDRAIDGAALALLTSEQKRELVLLARRAFDRVKSGRLGDASLPDFDGWRHEQVLQAVERPGISACRQEDFAQVKGHFLRLLGQAGMADRMQARAEMEPRRVAIWKLEHECGAVSDVIARPMEYAMSIARARYKVQTLSDLSTKQIWVLLFDLRRNAQRRRKRAA